MLLPQPSCWLRKSKFQFSTTIDCPSGSTTVQYVWLAMELTDCGLCVFVLVSLGAISCRKGAADGNHKCKIFSKGVNFLDLNISLRYYHKLERVGSQRSICTAGNQKATRPSMPSQSRRWVKGRQIYDQPSNRPSNRVYERANEWVRRRQLPVGRSVFANDLWPICESLAMLAMFGCWAVSCACQLSHLARRAVSGAPVFDLWTSWAICRHSNTHVHEL